MRALHASREPRCCSSGSASRRTTTWLPPCDAPSCERATSWPTRSERPRYVSACRAISRASDPAPRRSARRAPAPARPAARAGALRCPGSSGTSVWCVQRRTSTWVGRQQGSVGAGSVEPWGVGWGGELMWQGGVWPGEGTATRASSHTGSFVTDDRAPTGYRAAGDRAHVRACARTEPAASRVGPVVERASRSTSRQRAAGRWRGYRGLAAVTATADRPPRSTLHT